MRRQFLKIFFTTALALIALNSAFASKYEYKETRDLVDLVNDAAKMVKTKGESSFETFKEPNSRWRKKENYIFVLDPDGNMIVHPDKALEGKNNLGLQDINGRPIIKGLIDTAKSSPEKREGWYHYQWPVPGEILPRWKSSFVKLIKSPSGKNYIVGSGVYNDQMEKSFVQDVVKDAVREIEKNGQEAFALFHDQTGRFRAKDAYIFVIDPNGIELVNSAFPNFEGRSVLDVKDTNNKLFVREMLKEIQTKDSGWINYMWPRPGDSASTEKTTYFEKANFGKKWLMVAAGVYLPGARKGREISGSMTAPALMNLVTEASDLLEKKGEDAYSELRKKGSKWFKKDTYFFVWDMEGNRVLHAADPSLEGKNGRDEKDIIGRPYGKMFLEVASNPNGQGWAHYMYPYPGQMFPAWKSVYLKQVTFPSGKKYIVGSGSYHMQMDENLIEDVVNRAAILVKEKGREAFTQLRDKSGPFYFMDTYVFVDSTDGVELVNPAHPSLEGKNIANLKDARGKTLARDYINAAMKNGSDWVKYYWYKPGGNEAVLKKAFVRQVQSGGETFIIGSGLYIQEKEKMAQEEKVQ